MRNKKQQLFYKVSVTTAVVALLVGAPALANRLDDDVYDQIVQDEINKDGNLKELNSEIEEKADQVRDLEERIQTYEENIRQKQREELTLQSHISVIEDKIDSTNEEISKAEVELEVFQLEIEALQAQITQANERIENQKGDLAAIMRQSYIDGDKSAVDITFGNENFSDFYSDVEYNTRVGNTLQDTLENVRETKAEMEVKQGELNEKKAELAKQKADLEINRSSLEDESVYKEQLIAELEEDEDKFRALTEQVQQEKAQIDGQISSLQTKYQSQLNAIREEIAKRLDDDDESNDELTPEEQAIFDSTDGFAWPITTRTISCGFKCSGYPFARWFEHSGLDLPIAYGSPLYASNSGYVTIARFDGSANYAYIMIVHNDGLASVYGHVSCVTVAVDQYVSKGEQIGCTGGSPGTPGAGAYSTGAHLHFEIRQDGIPVDPLNYLP